MKDALSPDDISDGQQFEDLVADHFEMGDAKNIIDVDVKPPSEGSDGVSLGDD